jgi:basic amino acid/polyamine antiporter, APA family
MPPTPPRVVGPLGAIALVVGSMVGVGILLTPPIVARAVDGVGGFLGLWAAGGLVSLCGAACYAELGAMMPRGGGDVVFQREAFGGPLAAASGVVVFAVAFAASIAVMATAVGTYQAQTLADAALGAGALDLSVAVGPIPISGAALVALGIIGLTTGINLLGARLASRVQATLTVVPVVVLTGLALAVLLGAPVEAPPPPPPPESSTLLEAWLAVYFTFAGWPTVVYLAGEVRNPGRNVGIATVGGTLLVTALYMLVGVALVAAFGLDGLAGLGESGTALAKALLGPSGGVAMAVLVGIAILSAVNATVLAGARIAAALAHQGVLPSALGRLAKDSGAPRVALLVQAALAAAYVVSGTFTAILAASGVAMMLVGALTVAAALRLRHTIPDADRPFRVPALPLVAGIYVLVGAVVVAGSLVTAAATGDLGTQLVGVGILAVSWLGFWFKSRASQPQL